MCVGGCLERASRAVAIVTTLQPIPSGAQVNRRVMELVYLNVCGLTGVCNKHDVDRPINQLTTPTNHACCHQQVYDSYGQKCNHRFLLNYGFAIENNREADGFCPNEVSALGLCCIHVMSHIIMHDRVGKRSRRRRLCLPVFRSPSLTTHKSIRGLFLKTKPQRNIGAFGVLAAGGGRPALQPQAPLLVPGRPEQGNRLTVDCFYISYVMCVYTFLFTRAFHTPNPKYKTQPTTTTNHQPPKQNTNR